MLTFMLLVLIVCGAAIAIAVFAGIMAFSPVLLVVLAFIALDYVVLRMIFKRKKKKE